MSKKGINFPLGDRRDTENQVMDTVIFGNTFSSEPDPDIILKHDSNRIECLNLIGLECSGESCEFNTEDFFPEVNFDPPEEEFDDCSDCFVHKKSTEVVEIKLKIPSSNIDEMLQKKEEEDKSKSLLTVVQNNHVANFIKKDETSHKHMGMHKFGKAKEAHLL